MVVTYLSLFYLRSVIGLAYINFVINAKKKSNLSFIDGSLQYRVMPINYEKNCIKTAVIQRNDSPVDSQY